MEYNLDNLIKSFEQVNQLQQEAVKNTLLVCEPEINDILRLNLKGAKRIECILDMLLDVAFNAQVLKLFKQLCRHYYFIDPQATVFYIQSYREMWDMDDNVE